MLRATKFRLYPTPEQEKFLWGQWGAVRFVWNKALWLKRRFWKQKGESLSVIMDLKPLLVAAKKSKKYAWLKQYDSMALQESLRHLDGAYQRFFKHEAGFPKWKSRRGEQSSYHCTCVSVGEGWVRVPKIGRIKAVVHRKVEGKVKSISLSADTTGAYYAAVLYDDGLEEVKPIVDIYEDQVTGIDLGLKDLAIESNGTKEPNPKHLKKAEKHLRRVSKKFSRTKKGSRRHEKARKRLAKAHKRVANARNDRLHKISKRLIDENQAVCAESLKIKNIFKNQDVGALFLRLDRGRRTGAAEAENEHVGRLVPLHVVGRDAGHRRGAAPERKTRTHRKLEEVSFRNRHSHEKVPPFRTEMLCNGGILSRKPA